MTIEKKIDLLEELASYEGTELGDYWRSLTYIWRYSYCMADPEFIRHVETELHIQYGHAIDLIEDDVIEIPKNLIEKYHVGPNN